MLVAGSAQATDTRIRKTGDYWNQVKVGAATTHGAVQYFSRSSSSLTSTDTKFAFTFLEIKHNGTGQATVAVTMKTAEPAGAGGVENVFVPGGATVKIEGVVMLGIQVTTGTATGSLFITAER
jgi:hypothetical protein